MKRSVVFIKHFYYYWCRYPNAKLSYKFFLRLIVSLPINVQEKRLRVVTRRSNNFFIRVFSDFWHTDYDGQFEIISFSLNLD